MDSQNYAGELKRIRVKYGRLFAKLKLREMGEREKVYKKIKRRNLSIRIYRAYGLSFVKLGKQFGLAPSRISEILKKGKS